MKKILYSLCAVFIIFAFIGAASATPIFEDNFDSENGGNGVTNYTGFINWTVTDGTVDLIGNGYFDFFPGNGLYVDMDGSTNNAGKMMKTKAQNTHHADEIIPKAASALGINLDLYHM